MTIKELQENFTALSNNWQDLYGYIIDLGRKLDTYPSEFQTDEYRLSGCMSRVWVCRKDDRFYAVSDGAIVNGLIYIALLIYTEQGNFDNIESIFKALTLDRFISNSRRNGFFSLIVKIKNYNI